jgi:hypothetical protein
VLAAAAGNLPGITFTPASYNAVYLITAQVGLAGNNGTTLGYIQMTDGTTPICVGTGFSMNTSVVPYIIPNTLTGVYVPGTSSPVTVKLQVATNNISNIVSITSEGSSVIEWTVVRIA